MRTDAAYHREFAGTGPEVLKVALLMRVAYNVTHVD